MGKKLLCYKYIFYQNIHVFVFQFFSCQQHKLSVTRVPRFIREKQIWCNFHCVNKGFITPSGLVKCTLLEFNMFRQWIRKLKLDRLHQEYRRQRQIEKQQWEEKRAQEQLLRDEELYGIVRAREQKARELKERAIKRREADRRKYLRLQETDRKRREEFKDDLKRKKDQNECQREKALAKRQAEKVKEDEKVCRN